MKKIYFQILIREKKTKWFRIFYQKLFIRTTIILSLIYPSKTDFFQGSFEFFSSKPAFAQKVKKETESPKNHRLKNFLLSAKGRDEWTQLMLAI